MLRLNEVYHSFQGEGPNTGDPTLFVRFVGCNLKCPGWPCDSQHAIDPKLYRKDMIICKEDADDSEFSSYVGERWRVYETICFTGGEVTLQPIQDLLCGLDRLKRHTGADFELFTNGTLPWPEGFEERFKTIILDWKLDGSGELRSAQDQEVLDRNFLRLRPDDAIKFTIKDRADFLQAIQAWMWMYANIPHMPTVYAGPVWGSVTPEQVAEWMLEERLPWNLNVQTHKFVWNPDKRGV